MRTSGTFAAAALCAVLAACHTAANSGPVRAANSVRGTLTYRDPIALPAHAVVHVELSDVSRLDAPAVVVSERDIRGAGQLPIRFELRYDPALIDPRRAYAVRARINVDGRLWFTTQTAVRVITRGHPQEIEIVLRQLPPAAVR